MLSSASKLVEHDLLRLDWPLLPHFLRVAICSRFVKYCTLVWIVGRGRHACYLFFSEWTRILKYGLCERRSMVLQIRGFSFTLNIEVSLNVDLFRFLIEILKILKKIMVITCLNRGINPNTNPWDNKPNPCSWFLPNEINSSLSYSIKSNHFGHLTQWLNFIIRDSVTSDFCMLQRSIRHKVEWYESSEFVHSLSKL